MPGISNVIQRVPEYRSTGLKRVRSTRGPILGEYVVLPVQITVRREA